MLGEVVAAVLLGAVAVWDLARNLALIVP